MMKKKLKNAQKVSKWPQRTPNGRAGPPFFVDAIYERAAQSRRCQVFYQALNSSQRKSSI
jgi:hypothetical protein